MGDSAFFRDSKVWFFLTMQNKEAKNSFLIKGVFKTSWSRLSAKLPLSLSLKSLRILCNQVEIPYSTLMSPQLKRMNILYKQLKRLL